MLPLPHSCTGERIAVRDYQQINNLADLVMMGLIIVTLFPTKHILYGTHMTLEGDRNSVSIELPIKCFSTIFLSRKGNSCAKNFTWFVVMTFFLSGT
jgi:hypothetical protein